MADRCAPANLGGDSMPTKTRGKKTSEGKVNALQKPLQPSEELARISHRDECIGVLKEG
jgi:hypothetical protein